MLNNSNIDAIGGAMRGAIFLSRIGGRRSGPPADLTFKRFKIFRTPEIVNLTFDIETFSGDRCLISGTMPLSTVNTDQKNP